MQAFAYGQATDVREALTEVGAPDTVFLAGGTELLNWLRLGIAKPVRVIDIGRLADLAGIARLPNGGLHIGALTRLNDVALHEDVVRD
jgi:xanthine dehydrogenase YagS FAD-binding subunit